MATIWVREFTGGLDARRMPETTSGGVLIKAKDGHITRGGEFEKRPAFVREFELPSGTVGLAAGKSSIYVFGHQATPSLPAGVAYQRLQHSDGTTALSRILSYDLYAGKLYVVGEFEDGAVFHFYDGVRVEDWFDGRARASFRVASGGTSSAVSATGSFEVTGGTSNPGVNRITDIKIDGVSIINAAVDHTGNNATTASAIATAINTFSSSPDYSASASGQTVTITAVATGTAANGKTIVVSVGGNATTANVVNMAGGAAAATSQITALTVDGVAIISGAVTWATSNSNTASLIAAAINSYTSSPDYTATAVDDTVNIIADVVGTAANGRLVAATTTNGLVLDPASGLVLADGADTDTDFVPGTFVKTIGSRMHSVSGPNEHFSGIGQPTKWTTDTTGAGFIDMSTHASGAETLTALARYQNFVAVFAERVIQTWYFDANPALNSQKQTLNNTGTASPRSVTQFGDNDLFYLDESGLRSLRARDASNAAATTDIGVPVDALIVEKLAPLAPADREKIIGLINPGDGRFWLIMLDTIFVFSFYPGARISAWTTYEPSETVADTVTPFSVEDAAVFRRKVYVRANDKIYVFGGLGGTPEYDATIAEAWLPYLDADQPAVKKEVTGIDAALRGAWEVGLSLRPADEDAPSDKIGIVTETTYWGPDVAAAGESTHLGPRFKTTGSGYAKLGAIAIHYEPVK